MNKDTIELKEILDDDCDYEGLTAQELRTKVLAWHNKKIQEAEDQIRTNLCNGLLDGIRKVDEEAIEVVVARELIIELLGERELNRISDLKSYKE